MSLISWLSLISSQSAVGMLFFFFGINWQTVETKYRHSPMKALAVLYIVNFIMVNALFTSSPVWF